MLNKLIVYVIILIWDILINLSLHLSILFSLSLVLSKFRIKFRGLKRIFWAHSLIIKILLRWSIVRLRNWKISIVIIDLYLFVICTHSKIYLIKDKQLFYLRTYYLLLRIRLLILFTYFQSKISLTLMSFEVQFTACLLLQIHPGKYICDV